MHVLRIDVTRPGVTVRPLMRSVAERHPLSELARGHKNLVAAVNTGYFDFVTGAPTQPLIVAGHPLVVSAEPQRVFGFDATGALQSGTVALAASVVVSDQRHRLSGINTVDTNKLVAFDSSWGVTPIPVGLSATSRDVVSQRLGYRPPSSTATATVPADGYELVARRRPGTWLARQPAGAAVRLTRQVTTTAPQPFTQAYGVGTTVVLDGTARTGLACNSAGTKQPARTAVGFADNNHTLVIGEVEDHPGTRIHGLDEDQMAKFMEQLGVDQAWNVDGSGSTELLARMPGSSQLTLRTYPADGEERPMPVGLGITYRAPKPKHHH
jgi:hypothetical protein